MESVKQYIDSIKTKCEQLKPIVVITSITYNHGLYLKDALEGFVMQQTNFSFVAVVHDDASTDNTAEILREYADRYPDIILPIYETENQYSKHDGSLGRVIREARDATGAKYVALCEGDDYWTDPLKLQKQVDFLEAHPDYSMCCHNSIVHYEDNRKPDSIFSNLETREYSEKEITDGWIIATASFCFRSKVYKSPFYIQYLQSKKFVVGDYPLSVCLLRIGKIYALEDFMSVYRINPTGWTQKYTAVEKLIMQEIEANRIFGGVCGEVAKKRAAIQSREAISLLYKGCIKRGFRILLLAFKFAPWETVKANFKWVSKIIKSKF